MKNYNKAIGEALKKARLDKGYSLRKSAELLGVDHSTVGKWESGTNNILAVDLINYLQILNVNLEDFIKQF